nr:MULTISPECIES: hypothetical protein [unclassified Bradyrhizobium]
MQCLAHRPQLTFLDSSARHDSLGRYSYLACDPFSTFLVADGLARTSQEPLEGDPWEALRSLLAKYPREHHPDLPPFQGGAAGFFAYDLNRTLERLPAPEIPGWHLPQSIIHFYDVVLSYDHRDHRCWTVSTGWPEQDPVRQKELRAVEPMSLRPCLSAQTRCRMFARQDGRMEVEFQPRSLYLCGKARRRLHSSRGCLPG